MGGGGHSHSHTHTALMARKSSKAPSTVVPAVALTKNGSLPSSRALQICPQGCRKEISAPQSPMQDARLPHGAGTKGAARCDGAGDRRGCLRLQRREYRDAMEGLTRESGGEGAILVLPKGRALHSTTSIRRQGGREGNPLSCTKRGKAHGVVQCRGVHDAAAVCESTSFSGGLQVQGRTSSRRS